MSSFIHGTLHYSYRGGCHIVPFIFNEKPEEDWWIAPQLRGTICIFYFDVHCPFKYLFLTAIQSCKPVFSVQNQMRDIFLSSSVNHIWYENKTMPIQNLDRKIRKRVNERDMVHHRSTMFSRRNGDGCFLWRNLYCFNLLPLGGKRSDRDCIAYMIAHWEHMPNLQIDICLVTWSDDAV